MADQDETGAKEELYGIVIFYSELIVIENVDIDEYTTEIRHASGEYRDTPYDFEKIGREGFWVERELFSIGLGSISKSGKGSFVCPSQILKIDPL